MLRRTRAVFAGAQLSPYAQALKHVALKGSVALGPSAKEQEIDMYLRGALPADYRPPVQGKWDDTIERWAYAWQFPLEEKPTTTASERRDRQLTKPETLGLLVDFSQRLLGASFSTVPGSGVAKKIRDEDTFPLAAGTDGAAAADESPLLMTAEEEARVLALLEAEAPPTGEVSSTAAKESEKSEGGVAAAAALQESLRSLETLPSDTRDLIIPRYDMMVPAVQYAKQVGLPVAYIDDGSELAVMSREFGTLLVEEVGLPYDANGCTAVVRALSRSGYFDEARAVMHFAKLVGLHTALVEDRMFVALMLGHQRNGDVNAVMALIEEMKDEGITPSINTWHSLMMTCYNAGDYPAVQQIVDHMKAFGNIEPTEATFFLQLQALSRDKSRESNPYEAIQLFDQMENVYGYIPSKRHYHALMECCAHRAAPELQAKVRDVARKMELLGLMWDSYTCYVLLHAARNTGDTKRVVEVVTKMRSDGIKVHTVHLAVAIEAYAMAMKPIRANYDKMIKKAAEEGAAAAAAAAAGDSKPPMTPLQMWLDHLTVAFGIFDLLLKRGATITTRFLNSLLMITCEAACQCAEVTPDDVQSLVKFEEQANTLWEKTYDEFNAKKDEHSYASFITMLARTQRVDEAEKLFQSMVLRDDMTPTATVYQELMFMHLRSGEEGGTARALQYMDAMERAGLPVRQRLVRQFVKINDEAGYRRDMKRRARRIMQAREEYMAKKAEGVDMTPKPYEPPTRDEDGNPILVPLPVAASSTLAWWEKWKRESVSKHELFETERDDGLPRGEDFAEKNAALKLMGIESRFPTKDDVPSSKGHDLLKATNAEMGTGALWALDGGDLSYPKDGNGPDGWGVALWRQRQVMKKEFAKVLEGKAAAPPLTPLGNSIRVAPDQLAIEESGVATPGALADYRAFPEHVYDDGTAKPSTELAAAIPPGAELVWMQEKADRLAPFKTDAELSLDNDGGFFASLEGEARAKTDATIAAIKEKREDDVEIVGAGVTRKGKHDYLEKWREMYQHGTLEAPDKPVLRFGTTPTDHEETVAATIRAWYARQSKAPPTAELQRELAREKRRGREAIDSLKAIAKERQRESHRRARNHNKQFDGQAGEK